MKKTETTMREYSSLDKFTDNSGFSFPDDDIACKDCLFRKEDTILNGKVVFQGFKNGFCRMFEDEPKPTEILYQHEECEYYVKGDWGKTIVNE